MAERDVDTPIRLGNRQGSIGFTYEEKTVREPFLAPNRENPDELIVKGEIIGEPVALYGIGDTEHTVTITIYPKIGVARDGTILEGEPVIVKFSPSDRQRKRVELPVGVGLVVVDYKGRQFIEGHARIITEIEFAQPRVINNGPRSR